MYANTSPSYVLALTPFDMYCKYIFSVENPPLYIYIFVFDNFQFYSEIGRPYPTWVHNLDNIHELQYHANFLVMFWQIRDK
jgi:hypothetical protein